MKSLIVLIIFLFTAFLATAQTPFSMLSSHGDAPASLSASSQRNPWVGAKLAYNISGDVSESFLLSARALQILASGERFAIPALLNVGLNNPDSLSGESGVSLGVYPWYSLTTKENFSLILHGGVGYSILDKSGIDPQTQLRTLIALEAAIYGAGGGPPITLSVGPEYIWSIQDQTVGSLGLSITSVIPISTGLGILLEGVVPLNESTPNTGLKIGVIVNSMVR